MLTILRSLSAFVAWLMDAAGRALQVYAQGCTAFQNWGFHDRA